nr:MAG TPA: hypothetical protein [Bacteriophage sp.]
MIKNNLKYFVSSNIFITFAFETITLSPSNVTLISTEVYKD